MVKIEKNGQVQVIHVILECVYRHSSGGQLSTQQRSSQSISCKSPMLYTSVQTSTYHHTGVHCSTHQYTSIHTIHISSHEFTLGHISISFGDGIFSTSSVLITSFVFTKIKLWFIPRAYSLEIQCTAKGLLTMAAKSQKVNRERKTLSGRVLRFDVMTSELKCRFFGCVDVELPINGNLNQKHGKPLEDFWP